MTIESFGDESTERLFRIGVESSYPADVADKALQRMERLDATSRLDYLAQPAGMRLRKAPAFGADFYQVHVKGRWWLIFRWAHPDCSEVRVFEKKRRRYRR